MIKLIISIVIIIIVTVFVVYNIKSFQLKKKIRYARRNGVNAYATIKKTQEKYRCKIIGDNAYFKCKECSKLIKVRPFNIYIHLCDGWEYKEYNEFVENMTIGDTIIQSGTKSIII